MNRIKQILSALPFAFAMVATHAAAPAGAITQLSGWAMAVKPDGRARIVSTQSKVEVGETLVSEADSYVRLRLDDGNEAVMGPSTSLKVERFTATETSLSLVSGLVQVTGNLVGPARRFSIEAGENHVDAGSASFILNYVPPPPGPPVALRRAYVRSSLAALSSRVASDAGNDLPELVAAGPGGQVILPTLPTVTGTLVQTALNAGLGPRPPGLYVQVIDGLINVTNKGGSLSFAPGQFGFTPNFSQPPVPLLTNPGLVFQLPSSFVSTTSGPSASSGAKGNAVDCEVR